MKSIFTLLAVSGVAAVQAAVCETSDVSEIPTTYGADRITYTGATATSDVTRVFATTEKDQATTFEVTQAATDLTLAGEASPTNVPGALIKYGPGTLTWAIGTNVTFAGGVNQYASQDLGWDANGAALSTAGYGFPSVQVAAGRLRVDAPEAWLGAYDMYLGSRLSGPVGLDVSRGAVDVGNMLATGYQTDFTGATQPMTVRIGPGGELNTVDLAANQGSSNGAKTRFDVDGGTFTLGRLNYGINRTAGGTVTFDVHNGGTLDYNCEMAGTAYEPWPGAVYANYSMTLTDKVTVDVSEGATLKATSFGVTGSGALTARDGATVCIDRTTPSIVANRQLVGSVTLDGATVQPYTANIAAEWFSNVRDLTIGAEGVTAVVPNAATLDGTSTGAGTLTKLGAGTLSVQAGAANVDVREGSVAFAIANDGDKESRTGRITAAADAKVIVAGENALGSMELVANDQVNEFWDVNATEADLLARYNFVQSAQARKDGWIRLNDPVVTSSNLVGAVWQKTKMDLTRSFTVDFDYFAYKTYPELETTNAEGVVTRSWLPYGFSVGWQNVGNDVVAADGRNRGNGWSAAWPESFAFAYDAPDGTLHHTENGRYTVSSTDSTYLNGSAKWRWANGDGGSEAEPLHGCVSYDAESHVLTMTMTRRYDARRVESISLATTNDLTSLVGGNSAYFGFGGGGGGWDRMSQGGHLVSNVRVAYAGETGETGVASVGGRVTVPSGKTFNASLKPSGSVSTWRMDRLTFADGARIAVDGTADTCLSFAEVEGTGELIKRGAGRLHLAESKAGAVRVDAGTLTLEDRAETCVEGLRLTDVNWWTSAAGTNTKGVVSTPARGAVFGDGVMTVGRTSNLDSHYDDYATCRQKLPFSRSWTLSYDLEVSCVNVGYAASYLAIMFHNDPRGNSACRTEPSTDTDPCSAIANKAALRFHVGAGADATTGAIRETRGVAFFDGTAWSDETSTGSINLNAHQATARWDASQSKYVLDNGDYATNAVVTLEYSAEAKQLKVTLRQRGARYESTYAVDMAAAMGAEGGYLTFATGTPSSWYNCRQAIRNLSFNVAPAASAASAGTAVTAANNATVELMGTARVAELTAAGAVRVTATSEERPFAANEACWQINEQGAVLGGGFVTDGFRIGRAANAKDASDHYVGMVNSRSKIDVSSSFSLTYDLSLDIFDVGGTYGYYAISFHDDARGQAALGTANAGGEASCASVGNGLSVVWSGAGNWYGSYGNKVALVRGTAAAGATQEQDWVTTEPVAMGFNGASLGVSGNFTHATNGTVTIAYDAAAKTLTLTMTQVAAGETKQFSHVFADVDLAACVGGNAARIGFGANTAQEWFGIRQTVRNFRFEGRLVDAVRANAFDIRDNGTLTLTESAAGSFAYAVDALHTGNRATLTLAGASLDAAALTARGELTVAGGLLRIASVTDLTNVSDLNLTGGAQIYLPAGTTLRVDRLFVDGRRVLDPRTCEQIIGGGTVALKSNGVLIRLK